MMPAKVIGAPHSFLHKRFPSWKEDNTTYMIPPFFKAKRTHHEIGLTESVSYSDAGDIGESVVYDLLRLLGESKNIGMFVFHDFELRQILRRNKECTKVCGSQEYEVPIIKLKDDTLGECDFIIFHHTLGVVSLEVKNYVKIHNDNIESAEKQLKKSHDLIVNLATVNTSEDLFSIPYNKVIALPSTHESDFTRDEFDSLKSDTILLFADSLKDIDSFEKWWRQIIENPAERRISPADQNAYELALSYIMMIRHLSPVTETDCMNELHQSLLSYKYHGTAAAHVQILKNEFPKLFSWCSDILKMVDKAFDFGEGNVEDLRESFMKVHKVKKEKDLRGRTGMKIINKILEHSKYISGDMPTPMDKALAVLFDGTHFLSLGNILRFFNDMWKMWNQIGDKQKDQSKPVLQEERFPFLKLESPKDVNKLDRHLAKYRFLDGDTPSEDDKQLFESLTCKLRVKHSHRPMVMTTEQLAVFEGPSKQLIIGPPGSGKTELLKFKAQELENEMKACKSQMRILYIVANGSPKPQYQHSLLFYQMKEFFNKKSSLVDVISIILEEESAAELQRTKKDLRERIASRKYCHVFIDEYWIGSKPLEHEIILHILKGIQGYVWITSVFDYNQELMDQKEKMQLRTKPLLDTLKEMGGDVSRITQVARGTNNIIELERGYSALYQQRSYPYGTRQLLGHSLEGLPITWAIEKGVDEMYSKCVEITNSAIRDVLSRDTIRTDKLTLDPSDILIVDFAIRTNESLSTKSLEERLASMSIPVWTFGNSLVHLTKCKRGKVTLLNSVTRDDSSYIDGVEWPMVIVILPSHLLLETASLAVQRKAQKLRNYDPYISFFRAMVKLIIISDKWKDKDSFLADVEHKLTL